MTLDLQLLKKAKSILDFVENVDQENLPKVGVLLCGFRDHYLPRLQPYEKGIGIKQIISQFKLLANQYGIPIEHQNKPF